MNSPKAGPDHRPRHSRPFQPMLVGTCYAQTANDRFGNGASDAVRERERSASYLFSIQDESPFDWPESDADADADQNGTEASIYRLVPTMQRYRNNLTALSQLYNLYLVAYQGQIFVYVPRGIPRQTIPRHPDLRLVPRPSEASRDIGGYQDPVNPHTINHIIVGTLGREEVVVACYDDGDVVSYLTGEIADCIASKPSPSPAAAPPVLGRSLAGPRKKLPRPFLHENVGKSAWGLAVHKKSRLIAVSSNRCEVTVFALALAPAGGGSQQQDTCERCRESCDNIESHVGQRARNWRIVVTLGRLADNIPNLCFVDDDDGRADLMCAVDIKGAVWLADIWKPGRPATRIEPSNCVQLRNSDSWPALSRGWGVLALPRADFLKVETVEELLGVSGREPDLLPNWMVNVESCLQDIDDNPCVSELDATPLGQLHDQPTFEPVANAVQALDVAMFGGQALGADGSQHSDSDESSEEGDGAEDDADEEGDDDGGGGGGGDGDDEESEGSDDGGGPPGNAAPGQPTQLLPPFYQLLVQALPAAGALQTVDSTASGAGDVSAWPGAAGWGHVPGTATAAAAAAPQHQPGPQSWASRWTWKGAEAARGRDCDGAGRPASPPARLDMVYYPHEGLVFPVPPRDGPDLVALLQRDMASSRSRTGDPSAREKRAKRYHILRLHEKELELRSLEGRDREGPRELGVLCPQAMTMGLGAMSPATKLLFRATSRLRMVAHVPELSLVVVGSPIGRVLLVMPTGLAAPAARGRGLLQHGFRVDWVLPRRSDERRHRRAMRPLHGLAIAPVQEAGGAGGPRRYRLMLHYRNHDILTYEITRREETGKLCIF
ncbi:hypothetical protein CDD83_4061 [Cordyceps sp. RAO-2017]|nr:hypothetical protein CDD83_4061 [Cordyceps sp. RAO-2017]